MAKIKNPFKILGSWIGASVGLFLGLSQTGNPFEATQGMILNSTGNMVFAIVFLFITTSIGFLIGWGIHSFFRKIA